MIVIENSIGEKMHLQAINEEELLQVLQKQLANDKRVVVAMKSAMIVNIVRVEDKL